MPTPQTQRSTYRDRRINVMLQENLGDTPPAHNAQPAQVRHASKKSVLSISLATAALCAFVMFFLLFRRDSPQAVKNVPSQPVQVAAQAPPPSSAVSEASSAAPSAPAAAPAVAPSEAQTAAPISRVHFRLKRSSRSQAFGPLSLRLVSTSARKGICSLSVAAANSRPSQRTVQVNRPLEISQANGGAVTVLVNAINRDSISGYVSRP